jgi:hypothetical protein
MFAAVEFGKGGCGSVLTYGCAAVQFGIGGEAPSIFNGKVGRGSGSEVCTMSVSRIIYNIVFPA